MYVQQAQGVCAKFLFTEPYLHASIAMELGTYENFLEALLWAIGWLLKVNGQSVWSARHECPRLWQTDLVNAWHCFVMVQVFYIVFLECASEVQDQSMKVSKHWWQGGSRLFQARDSLATRLGLSLLGSMKKETPSSPRKGCQ